MRILFLALLAMSRWGWATPEALHFEDDVDLFYLNSSKKILCYAESDDRDGDHYADKNAAPVWTLERGPEGFCPSGFVGFGNDCDDSNADIHPFNDEKPFNRIDDDCDGRTDELLFQYGMEPEVHALNVRGQSGTKAGIPRGTQVEWGTLQNPNKTETSAPAIESDSAGNFEFQLTGLEPETAYRLRLKLGQHRSEWFYAVTSGESPLAQVRAHIIQSSLHEWDESERGKTGYAGSVDVDGTRYDAEPGEWWCSEYYSWVGKAWLPEMEGLGWVGALRSYFRRYSSDLPGSEIAPQGTMGDFLAMDSMGHGLFDHSGMLFAVESEGTPRVIWTLEGNSGNKTRLKRRVLAPDRFRVGHLVREQLH